MPIAMREVSAGNRLYLTEDEVAADGVKVLAGENCYDTISAAISAASGSSIQVKLLNDLKEDITIPEGKTLTLDLNGQTLTNVSSHTIVNQGALTILDSAGGGVVDVVTHGKAALYNKGAIPEISGGTFTRSKEAGTTEGGNGNSWYTVYNAGTIEKITGGTFENSGTFSSMLVNGWNNPGPAVQGRRNHQRDPDSHPKHQYHRRDLRRRHLQRRPGYLQLQLEGWGRGIHRHYYHQGWRCHQGRNQQYKLGRQQQHSHPVCKDHHRGRQDLRLPHR